MTINKLYYALPASYRWLVKTAEVISWRRSVLQILTKSLSYDLTKLVYAYKNKLSIKWPLGYFIFTRTNNYKKIYNKHK